MRVACLLTNSFQFKPMGPPGLERYRYQSKAPISVVCDQIYTAGCVEPGQGYLLFHKGHLPFDIIYFFRSKWNLKLFHFVWDWGGIQLYPVLSEHFLAVVLGKHGKVASPHPRTSPYDSSWCGSSDTVLVTVEPVGRQLYNY